MAPEPGSPPPQRPRPFSLFREFVLADFITLANAAAGTSAILLCLNYLEMGHHDPYIRAAFILLPLALIFDAADGFVARWRQRSSPFGADLDSLADVVSFGVAPAVLGFTLGLRGFWDGVVLVYFVSCGIARLARFNVTAEALSAGTGKVKYYEGTPIPTSLALVLILYFAWRAGHTGPEMWLGAWRFGPGVLHPFTILYAVSGSFMISRLRIPKP